MTSSEVVEFVAVRLEKGLAPVSIAEALCRACLADNTHGDGTGCDNMTVIVVPLRKTHVNGDASAESVYTTAATSPSITQTE